MRGVQPEYNLKNERSCAWSLCYCCGDHMGLDGQESDKKEASLTDNSLRVLSFFLAGDIGNKSLMVQRTFEINATVSSFPRHFFFFFARAHDCQQPSLCFILIQQTTFKLLWGSNMLPTAWGCVSSNSFVCVCMCECICVLVCVLEK